MKQVLILLLSVFWVGSASSQDRVVQKDGSTLRGTVEITYNYLLNTVKVNGRDIDVLSIERIEMEEGDVFVPRRVVYYYKAESSEEFRYVFLKRILNGSAKLYRYEGEGFKFVFEKDNKAIALQEVPESLELKTIKGFKKDLKQALGSCVSEQRIDRLRLREDNLIFLFNEFNECKDNNYTPLITPKKKDHIFIFDLAAGAHAARHSLSASVFRFNSARPVKDGEINQQGEATVGWVVDFSFQKNLFNSKNLFLYSSISLRKFSFNVVADDPSMMLSNFEFIEGDYMLGLSYQRSLFNKISLSVTSGGFFWTTKIQDNIRYFDGRYPVIPDYTRKPSGAGLFAQGGILYDVNEKNSFFINFRGYFRNGENMFSKDPVRIELSSIQNDDALQDLFTVLVGVRAKIFRKNY